ncbi:MAG: hypothetical protein ACRC2O_10690 [Chitinophagaceae bacterium]
MFERDILQEMKKWREKDSRKPLILRGGRQVGKTTVHVAQLRYSQGVN